MLGIVIATTGRVYIRAATNCLPRTQEKTKDIGVTGRIVNKPPDAVLSKKLYGKEEDVASVK